jgi:hypothetical protein
VFFFPVWDVFSFKGKQKLSNQGQAEAEESIL